MVGAQKPLYDIWGDTVNVASRMDYTGVKGCIQVVFIEFLPQFNFANSCNVPYIQVPEATAEWLAGEWISCTFRDTITVKGKGQMRTYFVNLTEDHCLIEITPMTMCVSEYFHFSVKQALLLFNLCLKVLFSQWR